MELLVFFFPFMGHPYITRSPPPSGGMQNIGKKGNEEKKE